MLYPAQDRRQPVKSRILAAGNRRQPDERVQFVDGSVSFNPQRILRDSLAAHQTGFSHVSALGVDSIQCDTRLVEWFSAHLPMGTQKPEANSELRLPSLAARNQAATNAQGKLRPRLLLDKLRLRRAQPTPSRGFG